jgi:hypothetical protein
MRVFLNIPGLVYQKLLKWSPPRSRLHKCLTNSVSSVSMDAITVLCSKEEACEILDLAWQIDVAIHDRISVYSSSEDPPSFLH